VTTKTDPPSGSPLTPFVDSAILTVALRVLGGAVFREPLSRDPQRSRCAGASHCRSRRRRLVANDNRAKS
jgi:hypothetical protein